MPVTYSSYRSNHQKAKAKYPFFKTEASATSWLQEYIYHGVGRRYLGWRFPERELQADGSWIEVEKAGPRSWQTPPKEERYKWRPVLEHLRGGFRGVITGSTHVPFVTTELDRHTGTIPADIHIRDVMATAQLLKAKFGTASGYWLRWCVEVNPKNGSVKFFGWANVPIPMETAKSIGKQIHDALAQVDLLGSGREVFPYNHSQVLLPFRWDKTTIIDTGVLPQCTRKVKDDDTGKFDNYETYSVLNFVEWLSRGSNFDDWTLLRTVQQACANLPDEEPVPGKPAKQRDFRKELATVEVSTPYSGNAADNPNSFERQHAALLEFCRRMKRVVSEAEALSYIKANKLYTGRWEQNYSRRRARVRWILRRIAETFDPAKCQGVRHEVEIGKFDQYARSIMGSIKGQGRRSMDEYGNAVVKENRYRVDWRFASMFLSVVEFCLIKSPNDDKSLPQVRAEDIWDRCVQGGLTDVPFCEKKWAICRDWLERRGIIKVVDRKWQRGKAMRWEVCPEFHRLPKWWRRVKKRSCLEPVALSELLANSNKRGNPSLNTYPPSGGPETELSGASGPVPIRAPP